MRSKSFELAKQFLGKEVNLVIDRPLGSKHSDWDMVYEVNYGYVPGTKAPDGEELDAYYLGVDKPIKNASGICIAIIHRKDDDDDKLVISANGKVYTDEEILKAVNFQEKWFEHEVIR